MLRIISEIKPKYVVGENVRGILSWNEGLVFEEVHTDLEAQGYEVRAYILPAAGVGAPHRRDRVWFVARYTKHDGSLTTEIGGGESKSQVEAWEDPFGEFTGANSVQPSVVTDSNSNGHQSRGPGQNRQTPGESIGEEDKWERLWSDTWGVGKSGLVTDTEHNGLEYSVNGRVEGEVFEQQKGEGLGSGTEHAEPTSPNGSRRIITDTDATELQRREETGEREREQSGRRIEFTKSFRPDWQNFPTQSPICGGDDGLPTELDSITFSKWRIEAIKALGNAIVPEVALQIFKSIQENDNT